MPRQPFPGVISAIAPQEKPRRQLGNRVNIFINGRFSMALAIEVVSRHNLRAGTEIDPAFLAALLAEDGDARAYAGALHFMNYRPRASGEVRTRLERDAWPDDVVARVLERLSSERLLDDSAFAALWVENRSLLRPRGSHALRQELRQKGVGRDDIDQALPDADQEVVNAIAAAQPRLQRLALLEPRERRQKLIEFLQRRGFSYAAARAALAQLEEATAL